MTFPLSEEGLVGDCFDRGRAAFPVFHEFRLHAGNRERRQLIADAENRDLHENETTWDASSIYVCCNSEGSQLIGRKRSIDYVDVIVPQDWQNP